MQPLQGFSRPEESRPDWNKSSLFGIKREVGPFERWIYARNFAEQHRQVFYRSAILAEYSWSALLPQTIHPQLYVVYDIRMP
jgi:hypothetical protein